MVKGYWVSYGYMGYVMDHYELFATEKEYLEFMEVNDNDEI